MTNVPSTSGGRRRMLNTRLNVADTSSIFHTLKHALISSAFALHDTGPAEAHTHGPESEHRNSRPRWGLSSCRLRCPCPPHRSRRGSSVSSLSPPPPRRGDSIRARDGALEPDPSDCRPPMVRPLTDLPRNLAVVDSHVAMYLISYARSNRHRGNTSSSMTPPIQQGGDTALLQQHATQSVIGYNNTTHSSGALSTTVRKSDNYEVRAQLQNALYHISWLRQHYSLPCNANKRRCLLRCIHTRPQLTDRSTRTARRNSTRQRITRPYYAMRGAN